MERNLGEEQLVSPQIYGMTLILNNAHAATVGLDLSFFLFLDAPSHLYKRVCPSVRPSVRPCVRPSVRPLAF